MGRTIGRYTLHAQLAAGGMGAVFLGVVRGEGGFVRTVAIKCMHHAAARDHDFVTGFLDEARLASRIRHPNVVSTIDVAHEGDELIVVMDYVRGESLSRLLGGSARHGAPASIAVAIAIGALHGLHAAHEATDEDGKSLGIVHRDVSPHNIMVGDDGVARVVDFGIAKAAGRLHKTEVGLVKGKLLYMAPEQVEGLPLDRRADIFALGIVLWEALAGQRLFGGASDHDIIANLLTAPIVPPSTFERSIPPIIDEIVMRALERDPEKRWPTAREMARALERTHLGAAVSDVAEFVEETAGDALRRRAAQLTEMERKERRTGEAEDLVARVASKPPARNMARGGGTKTHERAPAASDTDETEAETETETLEIVEAVEGIEGTATVESATSAAVTIARPESVRSTTRKRMHPAVLGGAAALVLAGALVVVLVARQAPPTAEPTRAASPPVLASSPPPPPPAPLEQLEIVEAPAPAPASASASAPSRPAVAKPRPKPAKPDCSDPYTRDELGRRMYRRECLK